ALPPIVHRTKPSRSRMNHTPARASARKLRSASRSQLEGGPETELAVRSGWRLSALTPAPRRRGASPPTSLDAGRGLAHRRDDRLRERDVSHARRHLLAVGQAVLDHLAKRRRLLRVLVLLVEEHPRIRGNRI